VKGPDASEPRFVRRVARLEARVAPHRWAWAEENRPLIDHHWAALTAEKPRMFNGRVLLLQGQEIAGEICRATYFETSYADFLAWRDHGFPDASVANGFAMGALAGSDGGFVLGVMGAHTANAGKIYFAAGTPDPSDVRPDGTVDLAGSVLRELREETGLVPDEPCVADHWIVARDGPKTAFLRPIRMPEPAAAVAARIERFLAEEPDPELAGVVVARSAADIDAAQMPSFLQLFLRWSFGEAG
jgi:8-oxo-dGTP pyrophosphatase MutT (NUDIX family)